MGTETSIQGLPHPERLGGSTISLLAPGYRGRTVQLEQAGESRAAGDLLPLADAAVGADAVVVTRLMIELQPPAPTGAAKAGGRGGPTAVPRLMVPAQAGAGYAVLHTDESGRASWLFPTADSNAQQAVFDIPENAASTGSSPQSVNDSRGEVTSLMRRLVRVVAWLTEPVIGAGARAIAGLWERNKRPYGLWQVREDRSLVSPRWSEFAQGPSLLLIHGTFSTPQVGFAGWLNQPVFHPIAARYGGRILAFAHPTLSASPQENIDWLLRQLPAGQSFDSKLDIVCHSRGGLLARELAARASAGTAPRVHRICQVGTPNLGTPLADASHWAVFLDSHTNCLTTLPDTTTTIVLEGLLCLVKIIGTGVARGLPGLAAMDPAGNWVQKFGSLHTADARWFTVGASYEPASQIAAGFVHQLSSAAADAAVDAFFAADNDMVVPTEGCHRPGTQVVESLQLRGGDTNHLNYFESREVQAALSRWLD